MTTFHVEIAVDNAAFCNFDGNPDDDFRSAEIARLLRRAASRVAEGNAREGGLVDANGNRIGSFWTEED